MFAIEHYVQDTTKMSNIHHHPHNDAAPATEGRTIRWADHYDMLVRLLTLGRERTLRAETIRQAEIASGASVLDVGCGTGTLTLLAKAQAGAQGKVYGIDPAPEMIAVARQKAAQQKGDVDFQVGLIEALPFEDGTFDVVLSSLMFHHLPPGLKQQGLREIYRVLKPGGRLLIADIKRPKGLIQHIRISIFAHSGMTDGVDEISPLMPTAGYARIQLKKTLWGVIGFLEGQRSG